MAARVWSVEGDAISGHSGGEGIDVSLSSVMHATPCAVNFDTASRTVAIPERQKLGKYWEVERKLGWVWFFIAVFR